MLFVSGYGQDATVTVHVQQPGARVSPSLHGIFFEEISHGGEGGLYAELIQNRGFEEGRVPQGCTIDSGWLVPPRTPHFTSGHVSDWKMKWEATGPWPAWSLVKAAGAEASLSLDTDKPLNTATPHALRVSIAKADKAHTVAVVNDGFWGIRVDAGEQYNLTFYARTEGTHFPITASLQTADGRALASYTFEDVHGGWKKYTCALKAGAGALSARFYLSFGGKGTVWLDYVSLFPAHTFKGRANGMRLDLANYLAALKPAFVRWPGGCFVEGISVESAPNWKRSLGPPETRPGTYSPWGYWSTDGIGYHEYLQFCEDIHADALYVFNCGVACEMRSGVFASDAQVSTLVADVLDAIEYAIGPVTSRWGAERARNGHPQPFPLKYVEVGNEQAGKRYAERFTIFYDAIKARYPQLTVIASMGIAHLSKPTLDAIPKLDMADEHAYKAAYWAMLYPDWYDRYTRRDWKLYVGEYACNSGVGQGNMLAALNDATYILGMERNADMITMSSYAPLLENVNDTDWPVNLIRFDHGRSFARTSYYAIQMLNEHKASVNLKTEIQIQSRQDTTPHFSGAIGLSTWDTQAEFKDIQVWENGKVAYTSAADPGLHGWQTDGGNWRLGNGILAQTADGAWPLAVLKDHAWSKYVLKLKARKTGGPNAFMIPLAIRDNQRYLRAHIGAWWNRVSAFEIVNQGTDAMVTQPVTLEHAIETGRWYDVELRVEANTIECFLDGKLLMTYHEPERFFSIAGTDEVTGEIIVKVVNAYTRPLATRIVLDGAPAATGHGKSITLAADSEEAENSFDMPERFVPVTDRFDGVAPAFEYIFKPLSVTILRLKAE